MKIIKNMIFFSACAVLIYLITSISYSAWSRHILFSAPTDSPVYDGVEYLDDISLIKSDEGKKILEVAARAYPSIGLPAPDKGKLFATIDYCFYEYLVHDHIQKNAGRRANKKGSDRVGFISTGDRFPDRPFPEMPEGQPAPNGSGRFQKPHATLTGAPHGRALQKSAARHDVRLSRWR